MGKKILFVDDSASMRQVMKLAMEAKSFEVTTAVDGVDGTKQLESGRFDVIISDLNMPNLNGIEFLKNAKKSTKNKFTPVIMLTTESADDMKQKGQAAGAKVWVVKPFRPEQLLSIIQKLIGG
ncbi:MAG: response regulator [Oleispira sp.]|nr:response regulator [Oleispira sp.]